MADARLTVEVGACSALTGDQSEQIYHHNGTVTVSLARAWRVLCPDPDIEVYSVGHGGRPMLMLVRMWQNTESGGPLRREI